MYVTHYVLPLSLMCLYFLVLLCLLSVFMCVLPMFDDGSGRNKQSLERTGHKCFLPSFGSFGQVVSEEKIFFKSANQKQKLPMAAMFVNGSELNMQSL